MLRDAGRDLSSDGATTPLDGFLELRRGMRGSRVGEWQLQLLKLGYSLPRFGAAGNA